MREPAFDFHISALPKLFFNHSESCWVEGSVGPFRHAAETRVFQSWELFLMYTNR